MDPNRWHHTFQRHLHKYKILRGSLSSYILQDPLAIMGLLGLLVPFVILGVAIATGVIDISKGKL